MSSKPPEPEKYSLDEMMDRLQSKPDEDSEKAGELVTRADGTQAIKIRKRKRRSTQPQKEEAQRKGRTRAIQISAIVVLLLLLTLGIGGLLVYTNSAPYRRGVVSKISEATGAKTDLYQFRVNPTSSNIAQAELKWPDSSLLKAASLSEIRTKALIAGALSNSIGVDEISAGSGKIILDRAAAPEAARPANSKKSLVTFERLGIAKTDIIFGNPAQPALQIAQVEASLYPENVSGHPNVRLFRGVIKAPDWPQLRLDRGLVEIQGSEAEIVSLRLLHETDSIGDLTLSGHLNPYSSGLQTLAVKVESFNLSGIAGPTFSRLLDARINSRDGGIGSNQLSFSTDAKTGSSISIAFVSSQSTPTRLRNFSFLGVLAQLLENRAIAEPIFDNESTGIVHREKGIVRVSDLSLISKGQMKVTGELTLKPDDSLSGTLQIGVPEAFVIASSNERLKGMFTDNRENYRWVTLKISGTSAQPVDNLVQLYDSAKAGTPASEPADLFEKLTSPPIK